MAVKPKLALIPSGYKASKVYSVLPSDGVGDFDFSRSGQATRVNEDGLIETVDSNVPRLNYPMIDGVVSGCPSLLLEPARTNLIQYSEDFSNASWIKTSLTITSNQTTSPKGDLTADLLTKTAGGGFIQSTTPTASTSTQSFFVKKDTSDWVYILNGVGFRYFDLVNGVKGNGSDVNSSIEDFGNDWWKITITTNSTTYFRIYPAEENSTSATSGSIYIWGAQLEEGSYATSYIPTNGSQVTRNAETCNGAGDANTFNDSEGVLFAEISALDDDLTFRTISISDGSTSNNVGFGYRNNSNVIYTFLKSDINSSSAVTVSDITLYNKVAVKYKSGEFQMWINGFERYSSTTTFTLSGLNEFAFDNGGGSANFYGNTKQIQYFDTVLNDTDLEELTSWTSFSEMATGQLYTIE